MVEILTTAHTLQDIYVVNIPAPQSTDKEEAPAKPKYW